MKKGESLKGLTRSEMFSLLLEKPTNYIPAVSISKIQLFMAGYMSGSGGIEVDPVFLGFTPWLQKRLKIRFNVDWSQMLGLVEAPDGELFFESKTLWAEYLADVEEHGLERILKEAEDWLFRAE